MARTLALLRLSDYLLVVVCGTGFLGSVPELFSTLSDGRYGEAILQSAVAAAFAFAAYTGWKNVGVIDQRVWRAYLWVLPLLTAVAFVMALGVSPALMAKGWGSLMDFNLLLSVSAVMYFVAVAAPSFVCVLLLRRAEVPSIGLTLRALLERLTTQAGDAGRIHLRVPRGQLTRGLAFGLAGALILLVIMLVPFADAEGQMTLFARTADQLRLLAFFLIVRARRYFQVNADALLAVDHRAPVLFLRAFEDDEKQQYSSSQRALLDFSLETRLANHFSHFGPFIAVGSPQDTVPQPGAARARLGDDEWQSRVLSWMREANLIVMYCGKTQWVNWELRQVIESGRATRLILLFPEITARRSAKRKENVAARTEQVRAMFKATPWTEELTAFDDFEGLRAMLFRPDGSMLMVKSKSRSREAYHLAALIAHQQLLEPVPAEQGAAASAPVRPWWWRWESVTSALIAVLIAFGLLLSSSSFGERLAFKKGEVFYRGTVTEAQAQRLGDHLLQRGYFSNERATSVQIDRSGGVYRLRFVVGAAYRDDADAMVQFQQIGAAAAQAALEGAPLEVALCDESFEPIKVLPQVATLTYGGSDLNYAANVSKELASAVGEQLVAAEVFGDDRAASVWISQNDDAVELRFVVDPSKASDPEVIAGLKALSGAIATDALGGRPVVLRLCDPELNTLRSERVDPRKP